jgi:Arc/MetJ-type ribon-helix-helix transcriptional regulator
MGIGLYTESVTLEIEYCISMSTSRTHITLPEDVRADLDRLVEKRSRSRFITEAVRKALLIARQKGALRQAAGAWKDKDHPELKRGATAWVRKLRRESEVRFKKQFRDK